MNETSSSYSFFWPLQILITGLLLTTAFQTFALNSQRSQAVTLANSDQIAQQLSDAQKAQAKLSSLANDLAQAAKTNATAAAILNDSHIQINNTNVAPTPAKK